MSRNTAEKPNGALSLCLQKKGAIPDWVPHGIAETLVNSALVECNMQHVFEYHSLPALPTLC